MTYNMKMCYNNNSDNMIQKGIDDNTIIRNSQISRKSGNGSSFNYELEPLITNFSFYDFINVAHKTNDELQDHGAFLVVTDKQYIIGYNGGFGLGTHLCSFGRVYKDINGGGNINMHSDGMILSDKCENRFITARIVYERTSSGFGGYIKFKFPEKRITLLKLEVFKKFVDDYGTEVNAIVNKYGIKLECYYTENGIMYSKTVETLEDVLEIAISITSEDSQITSSDDEVIIGTEVKQTSNHL